MPPSATSAKKGWMLRRSEPPVRQTSHSDAADLLVPFMFLLWWATANTASVDTPYAVGIRTSGRNGGATRCDVTNQGLQFAPANIDTCPTILEFDPASLVLTAYNRVNSGTVRRDQQLASDFRSLFNPI
jgi:hypothetical protein